MTTTTNKPQSNSARLKELESRVDCSISIETQLEQTKALADLITNVAETPSQIRPEMIGWVGSLLDDQLARLELAIEREVVRG